MVARFTQLTFSSQNVENAKNIYYDDVAPVIRAFPGNVEVMLLEPEDETAAFISFSLWESAADLEAFESSADYKPVIGKIKAVAEGAEPKYYTVRQKL